VDDNQDGAETMATALHVLGFDVRTAHDGPAALTVAADFHPEIALVDIGLPLMDGYELAGRLRAQLGPHAALVALTGFAHEHERVARHEARFAAYLVKPVSLARLAACLNGLSGAEPVN
jgi:DNA-binding response OmpR family regulator